MCEYATVSECVQLFALNCAYVKLCLCVLECLNVYKYMCDDDGYMNEWVDV